MKIIETKPHMCNKFQRKYTLQKLTEENLIRPISSKKIEQ